MVRVCAACLHDAPDLGGGQAAGNRLCKDAVHQGVDFGVVPKEVLAVLGIDANSAGQKRRELVAKLTLDQPESSAAQVV